MTKKCLIIPLIAVSVSLSACGSTSNLDTPKSSELSSEYSYYQDSVKLLRSVMNITPEKADDVFIILSSCGVDEKINYVFKNGSGNDTYYTVWYGSTSLKVYLNNSTVDKVLSAWNKEIYPTASDSTESSDKDAKTKTAEESETETTVPHRTDSDIVGVSDKDISDINIYYYDNVKNDVTGNWRYSMTADNIDIENYALSYYKTYFKSDSEIHGIVNFTRNTTSSIRVNGGILFLDIYDYVDGEEKDAKLMFSGTLLKSYMIYTDNGDIQQIQ